MLSMRSSSQHAISWVLASALLLCASSFPQGTPIRSDAIAARGQLDTLCGRVFRRPPTLTASGVGPVRMPITIEELRRICPEARDTNERMEGVPALRLSLWGSLLLATTDAAGLERAKPATGVVTGVLVVGGNVGTAEGVKSGTTLRELRRLFRGPTFVMCDSRLFLVRFRTRPGVQFFFPPLEPCREGRETSQLVGSDTLRVAAIGTFYEID